MKLVESFLGFKQKKSAVLQQRNSILKLLLIINIPNIILIILFSNIIPEPYMDEQFHYRQFVQYYHNRFSAWDNKITTPPGLYLIQKILSFFMGGSLMSLRIINSLFFSNIFVVFILKIYDFQDPCPNNLSRSLNLALSPTIYFFNFLDYTDSASVALIATMFYYNLVKSQWRLAFVSFLAVMVRQNNIVWILYLIIYRVLSDHKKQILAPKNFLGHIFTIIKIFLGNKILILSTCKLQLIVMTLFGFYLKLFNNGRFIFGDHLNHQITFHPNQMLYLSLFILVNLPITFGEFLSGISNFFQRIYISRHSLSAYLFILSLSIIFVDKYTLIHQFILADNRHYTFYIYRYILKYNFFKYLLCFMYAFSFNVLFKLVVNSELKLIKFILWLGASFGYLCFGQLVQFRYFAIPFLMFSFELQNKNFGIDVEGVHKQQNRYTARQKMIWTNSIKVVVNIIIFGIFLGRQFNNQWGTGRLMW